MIKALVKKYLKYFSYFYTHLRYRVFIALVISLIVGLLDGFGLAMFLPLLEMVDGKSTDPENLGNMRFLVDGMSWLGISMTVTSVLLVILFFIMLKGVARFVEAYYKVLQARFFIKNMRFQSIERLGNYKYKAFVMADVGRIQNTLSGEVGKVFGAYRSYFLSVQGAVMVGVYVFMAFLANPQFAVLVLVGAVISNLVYRRIYIQTKEASKTLTRGAHKFQALLIQNVAFFKYLKATGLMTRYARKMKSTVLEIEAVNKKMGWYNAVLSSTKEPLVVVVVIGVIIVQLNYFSESLGTIILSLLFFYRSLTFLMNLQMHWNTFLAASGSLDNMTEFMAELRGAQDRTGGEEFTTFTQHLEMKNLSFRYGSIAVLHNVNVKIERNETVAFVGESGSGKTTLVNLFAGLMPVDEGKFLIDGRDASVLNTASYQRRIGYITQEPVIFSDTIYNNVTFWDERTPENEEKFWEALRQASIDEFIKGLPLKENSLLGNNGILVSGGQKQRISIARELYKAVDILIMDEATSALDSETERAIQANIESLKGKYTILIVAHRLATIKNADRVVLLNRGEVECTGTFDELKELSSRFEKMVELQEV
jgi:ABC-type multidrug transport system fused ATPase/permease subunit